MVFLRTVVKPHGKMCPVFVQVPRQAGGARQGDKTREILGASVLAREDSEDSAIGEAA